MKPTSETVPNKLENETVQKQNTKNIKKINKKPTQF